MKNTKHKKNQKDNMSFTGNTFESIVHQIKTGDYKNVIVMCGAGLSTSAGIPDYRTAGTGMYDNIDEYFDKDDLDKSPQNITNIRYFEENPMPFTRLVKKFMSKQYHPTKAHKFIKTIQDLGVLTRCYTQNIDGLELKAGVSIDKLVQAHGSLRNPSCTKCHRTFPSNKLYRKMVKNGIAPKCSDHKCHGFVKPDIVMFGEPLPSRFFELTKDDFQKCDVLIILGTSLKVMPFALLANTPSTTCRIMVNMDESARFTNNGVRPFIGQNDVFIEQTCDEFADQFETALRE